MMDILTSIKPVIIPLAIQCPKCTPFLGRAGVVLYLNSYYHNILSWHKRKSQEMIFVIFVFGLPAGDIFCCIYVRIWHPWTCTNTGAFCGVTFSRKHLPRNNKNVYQSLLKRNFSSSDA